jgi:hypothetical protein
MTHNYSFELINNKSVKNAQKRPKPTFNIIDKLHGKIIPAEKRLNGIPLP